MCQERDCCADELYLARRFQLLIQYKDTRCSLLGEWGLPEVCGMRAQALAFPRLLAVLRVGMRGFDGGGRGTGIVAR